MAPSTAPARPWRLLSTDLDGTLIDFEKGVPANPLFFQRLAEYRKKGEFIWVLNTGRWWDSLALAMVERGFPFSPDWLILTEREVYKIHDHRPIGDYGWNRRATAVHAALFERVAPFWDRLREFVRSETGAELLADAWSPVAIRARHDREIERIAAFIEEEIARWPELAVVRNGPYFRFSHVDFHKGGCLGYLQGILGVTPEETIAAGDHHNDLPMLETRYAHGLICPGNAIGEVQRKVRAQGGYAAKAFYGAGVIEGLDALVGAAK
ncbi:MAG: HAD family hydrolase [Verrucomicrobium sp.]|nr:HAD family hydrolase [Verrucomicrobium sp.]